MLLPRGGCDVPWSTATSGEAPEGICNSRGARRLNTPDELSAVTRDAATLCPQLPHPMLPPLGPLALSSPVVPRPLLLPQPCSLSPAVTLGAAPRVNVSLAYAVIFTQ